MQVGRLGKSYSRWLHTPEPVLRPRFFANPLLEAITATEWCVPMPGKPAGCLVASSASSAGITSTRRLS